MTGQTHDPFRPRDAVTGDASDHDDPGSGADSPPDGEQQPDGSVVAPEPENGAQGVAVYDPDAVPSNAADVVAWIGEAETDDDRTARATAAWLVESTDHDPARKTVQTAVAAVLDEVDAPE